MMGDEREPTPGARPCLDGLFSGLDKNDVEELYYNLVNREYNYVDVLLYYDDHTQVYARCFVSLRCLEVMEVAVRICNSVESGLRAFELPEVDSAEIDGNCAVLHSRPDPPLKARNLIRKLGIPEPKEIKGYRVLRDDEVASPA